MCDTPDNMDTRSEPAQETDIDGDDEISVGSHSPLPPNNDTDDSMIDVDDSANEDESINDKGVASPKVEPPDPAMSPGPPRTPPVAHQGNQAILHRSLKFSIDNILKPDFGRRIKCIETSEEPVDLSRDHNRDLDKKDPLDPTRAIAVAPNSLLMKQREDDSLWPAWVYCTRYSDRPSAGPRTRRIKKRDKKDEKRPRTAFTSEQLNRLKKEFQENSRYLTEKRRQDLARDLGLNESQIKIWFQNKRAKIKKQAAGQKNPLALQLMAQGLYNHSTVAVRDEEEEKQFLSPV